MTPDCVAGSGVKSDDDQSPDLRYQQYQTIQLSDYAHQSHHVGESGLFGLPVNLMGPDQHCFPMGDLHNPVMDTAVSPSKSRKKTGSGKRKKTVVRVADLAPVSCHECNSPIFDRYILQIEDKTYHLNCLRCIVCEKSLDTERSCYVKNDGIYCRQDYTGLFGTRCSKCARAIAATDWVRRARDCVYHLACFACDICKRQLSTGEECTLVPVEEGDTQLLRLLCKTHYIDSLDGGSGKNKDGGDSDNSSTSSGGKPKTKRMRTTFTDEQLQVLQASFNLDSNPDGQDLERIAQMTGLSKRVTQVWFQNSRARQKKHQQQSQRKLNGTSSSRQSSAATEKVTSSGNCRLDESAALQLNHVDHSHSPHSSCDNVDSSSQFSSSYI